MENPKVITVSDSSKKFSLVVAIDFGTTRSGFVYCHLDDGANEINTSNIYNFQDWGGYHNVGGVWYAKNRTEILMDGTQPVNWGWGARKQIEESESTSYNLLTLFKLHLQKDEDFFVDNNIKYNTIDTVAIYLSYMKEMIIKFRSSNDDLLIPNETILWCLTVPALWNDKANDRMKEAAIKAGLVTRETIDFQLRLVKEPEAAAVSCYFNTLSTNLKVGESFLVIDAGGGTIDLTSYVVSGEKKLEELAKSSGDMHGSSYVDKNFFAYLMARGLNHAKLKADRKDFKLLIAWEETKHSSTFNRPPKYVVKLHNWKHLNENYKDFMNYLRTTQNGIDDEIYISENDFLELFHPTNKTTKESYFNVFEGIKQDIEAHINSLKQKGIGHLDYIFLVGGFNNNLFLNDFIQSFKYLVSDKPERIIKPKRPEQAIMEGACIYAINPSIIHSRISRLTYGLRKVIEFNREIHPMSKCITVDGVNYCSDIFNMACRKNDSIPFDDFRVFRYVPLENNQQEIPISIFCSDNENPYYTDETGVKKLGEIIVPLPGYGKDREVQVLLHFGDVDIKVETENLTTKETKTLRVKFSSSFG